MKQIKDILSEEYSPFVLIPQLYQDFNVWSSDNGAVMAIEYINGHSGDKWASVLLDNLLEDDELTLENAQKLARIIYIKFNDIWTHKLGYLEEYNPLWNYDMEEVRTPDLDETTKHNTKTTTTEQTYAFNSSNPVNANKSISEEDGNENVINVKNTGTETLTRHGNIGVMTTADVLERDEKFWSRYNFIESIYQDVDKILTLQVY